MSKNENKKTVEKKEVRNVTYKDMYNLMKVFDENAIERLTTNNDICVQLFDGSKPATRCELWKRSNSHYDLYVGNATNLYKLIESRKHLTYIDDKKMSKNELLIKFIDKNRKDAFSKVDKFVDEIVKKVEKEATKEIKEEKKEVVNE